MVDDRQQGCLRAGGPEVWPAQSLRVEPQTDALLPVEAVNFHVFFPPAVPQESQASSVEEVGNKAYASRRDERML